MCCVRLLPTLRAFKDNLVISDQVYWNKEIGGKGDCCVNWKNFVCSFKEIFYPLSLFCIPDSPFPIAVFWDVAPRSLVKVYRRCRGAYCLHHQGRKHFWNVCKILTDCTAQHSRRHLDTRCRENLVSHQSVFCSAHFVLRQDSCTRRRTCSCDGVSKGLSGKWKR